MTNSSRRLVGYAALLFAALLVQVGAGPGINSDDVMYSGVLNSDNNIFDAFNWLINRFNVWSSRSLIDALTILIVDHTVLWMGLNAIMLTVLALSISSLGNEKGKISLSYAALAMGCLWLAPSELVFYSVWWVTGSLNYLWPTAAALMYWAITRHHYLYKGSTKGWLIFAAIAAQFYSSFSEQVTLTSILVHIYCIFRLGREYWRNRLLTSGLALCIAGIFLYILAPGNTARMAASIQLYYPAFTSFSLFFKAYLGISLGVYQFFYYGSWISVIFCIVMFFRFPGWPRNVSIVVAIVVMLFSGYMVGDPGEPYTDTMQNIALTKDFYPGTLESSRSAKYLTAVIIGIFLCIALAASLALGESSRWRQANISRPLLFILSFIPSAMLGFSPTLYASGPRIFFISFALTILLIVMMARPSRYYWSFLAGTSVIACFTYV